MSFESPTPREGQRERYCVLVIYGVPVLLGIVTASAVLFGNSIGMTGTVPRLLMGIAIFNAALSVITAVLGEVSRRGSVARRVWSAIFYGVVGMGVYAAFFMLLICVHDAVVHFGYAFLEWRRPTKWRMPK